MLAKENKLFFKTDFSFLGIWNNEMQGFRETGIKALFSRFNFLFVFLILCLFMFGMCEKCLETTVCFYLFLVSFFGFYKYL